MGAVLVCGAECGSTTRKFIVAGGTTISTSTVRTGQRSFRALPAGSAAYAQTPQLTRRRFLKLASAFGALFILGAAKPSPKPKRRTRAFQVTAFAAAFQV